MKNLSAAKVRSSFSEVINEVAYAKERVTITRNGKELAAVIPMEDLEALKALEDKLDLEQAKASLKEAKRKGTKSWSKIKAESGL